MDSGGALTLQAAGTVGNFGPGFDVLSLAVADIGDTITIEQATQDSIAVTGPGAHGLPSGWHDNVAGIAVDALRKQTGDQACYHITLDKPRPGCSGLGSSASSAGGIALAYRRLTNAADLTPTNLIEAAYEGEQAAGGGNPDDVAAVVLGGIALVTPLESAGTHSYQRLDPPSTLHLAMLAPDLALSTPDMRRLLPKAWPRQDVLWNAARLVGLVHACHTGDVQALGQCLDDRLHTPYRSPRMPHFRPARQAALDAGAYGACISGSGPALIAVADDPAIASQAANAMREATQACDIEAEAFVAKPELGVPHAL